MQGCCGLWSRRQPSFRKSPSAFFVRREAPRRQCKVRLGRKKRRLWFSEWLSKHIAAFARQRNQSHFVSCIVFIGKLSICLKLIIFRRVRICGSCHRIITNVCSSWITAAWHQDGGQVRCFDSTAKHILLFGWLISDWPEASSNYCSLERSHVQWNEGKERDFWLQLNPMRNYVIMLLRQQYDV